MRIQRGFVRLGGMLHGLFRMLVAGLVVFFSVVYRGSAMRMRRLFVEFRRALMRIVGHDDPFITRKCYDLANGVIENFKGRRSQRLYCIEHWPMHCA